MSKKFNKNHRNRNLPIKQTQQVKVPPALVDIVLPVHRRFDLLGKCIDALDAAASGIAYNILIFDNASPANEKVEFYSRNQRSNLLLIESDVNIGYPKACNLATSYGKSPLILQLNSDVVLEPESLEQLCLVMDDPTIGICGMKLKFPDSSEGLDAKIRPAGRLQHICLSINIRGEVHHPFMAWDINHPKVNKLKDVWGVTGAALMTRRHIWNKVGGYNEVYTPGTYEDVDYCMTVRELGYNIVTCPQALGTHYTGATTETYKIAYPLRQNYMTFLSRWQSKLQWQDWKVL